MFKRLLTESLLFIAVFAVSACSVRREVADLWRDIQEKPDSVLSVLNHLDPSSYRGRTLADYRLLKAMALDKTFVDVASDSLAGPAAEFYHRHGPSEKEMMSLYYLGIAQYYSGDYHSAIISLEKARHLAEACRDLRYLGMIESSKSYVYCSGENYVDAIESALSSLRYFSQLPDSSLLISRSKLQLAECYLYDLQYDNAYANYYSVLSSSSGDTLMYRRELPNMAWSLYMSEPSRKGEALHLFDQAINTYQSPLDPLSLHHFCVILLECNRMESFRRALQILKSFPGQTELIQDLEYRQAKKAGDSNAALQHLESLHQDQDLSLRRGLSQSLVRRQRDYNEQEMNRTEGFLRAEHKKNHWLFVSFLLFFILVVCVGFVLQKKVTKTQNKLIASITETNQELKALMERNSALEDELELARQKYVLSFKKQFQKIGSLVEYYHETSGRRDARDLVYRQVMDLSATVGKDRQSMKALERSVNVSLNNAMKLYREDYPNKSTEHYNLVCYFMAGFSASLIEVLTGIPRNTIYSKKLRLVLDIEKKRGPHCDQILLAIK